MGIYELFGFTMYSDGCTFVGSKKLLPACLIHDLDYSLGGVFADKVAADERLYDNLYALGSVTRSYWMKFFIDQPPSMRWWGNEDDLIVIPSVSTYPWRKADFDVKSNFWKRID